LLKLPNGHRLPHAKMKSGHPLTSLSSQELNLLPRWAIVALISRAARHFQQDVTSDDPHILDSVNNALSLVEESARNGCAEFEALRIAAAEARGVSHDFQNARRSTIATAAEFASRAAELAAFERQRLVRDAQVFLQDVANSAAGKAACLAEDLRKTACFAKDMAPDSPAPPNMLNFTRQQAVHEAGHVLAAHIVKLPYDYVQIIYNPHVAPTHDLCEYASDEEKNQFRQFYVAGAAAEEVSYGSRRRWAHMDDERQYETCGGRSFDSDVTALLLLPGFEERAISEIVRMIEQSNPPWNAVEAEPIAIALRAMGIEGGEPY
jgi:hypothetical protein